MNVVSFNERSCERFRRYFDAYLDNELLIETSQDVLHHLSSCPECSRNLEARARMKQLVKDAVTREEAPPELVAALQSRIHRESRRFFSGDTARWMMAAAAVVLLAIGGFATLRQSGLVSFGRDEGLFHTVSTRMQEILRVGLIDHVHCTILYQQWKRLLSFDEMKAKTGRSALGPEFIDLVPVVQAKLGNNYKIVQGHRCSANRRQYVHIIVQGEGNELLSVVITRKRDESFTQADAVAVLNASGIPIYRARQGQLEIAGFETDKYLAYVVSNLDRAENLRIAKALAPAVRDHLQKLDL